MRGEPRTGRYAVVLALLVPIVAAGHEASKHGRKPIEGGVVSVEGDRLSIATAAGAVVVTLTEATKFERADRPATRDALETGVHVSVFGTKLPGGELVAREVVVHRREGGAPGGHRGPAPPGEKPEAQLDR